MKEYKTTFYSSRHSKTEYSAETILIYLLEMIPGIESVVDIGCGVGTWLHVSMNKGIKEILGIDGPWVKKEVLVIPEECFLVHDLSREIVLPKRYDLAISLEVGEHIPSENVHMYLKSLVSLSDIILFSGAIPFQGGRNHVNEQWPDYWYRLFQEYGYDCLDVFRKNIWNDKRILPWYKQNILLFIKKELIIKHRFERFVENTPPLSLAHPDIFIPKMEQTITLRGAWKLLWKATKRTLKR